METDLFGLNGQELEEFPTEHMDKKVCVPPKTMEERQDFIPKCKEVAQNDGWICDSVGKKGIRV